MMIPAIKTLIVFVNIDIIDKNDILYYYLEVLECIGIICEMVLYNNNYNNKNNKIMIR